MATSVKEDPASAMQKAQRDFASQRRLVSYLDRIIEQEGVRNAASDRIRSIWKEIRLAGFNEQDARTMLVRRACSARP